MATEFIEITGRDLTQEEILRVVRGTSRDGRTTSPLVRLHSETRAKLERTRKRIEDLWLQPGAPAIYGFNTGCGKLKDVQLSPEEIADFNQRYTLSHCVGACDPLKNEVVHTSMLVRSN